MTLAFMTHWGKDMGDLAGKPTYFVEKILSSIDTFELFDFYSTVHKINIDNEKEVKAFFLKYNYNFNWEVFINQYHKKIHTIRTDPANRWKAGNKIHMVINNRSPLRLQFAPTLECTSVQKVDINTLGDNSLAIKVNEGETFNKSTLNITHNSDLNHFVQNDGFPSIHHFIKYFRGQFKGNIIHWTEVKY